MNATPEPAPRAPLVHPLRVRDFRLLWAGATVSLFGDQFYLVALPWLVLQLTGSGLALGTVLMAAAIPRAVFMLVGGAVTDRLSPRRIMLATAAARTVLVAAVGALVWLHVVQLWHLYCLGAAFGLADAFSYPAHQALIPTIVAPGQLPAANSMVQGVAQASTIVGPAPAAIVVKRWGIAEAFFIDAVSFLFIIAALWRLPERPRVPPGAQPVRRPKMWHSISEGLRYTWRDPPVRSLVLIASAINLGITGPMMIGISTLAKLRLGSVTALGSMFSVISAGALAGILLAGAVRRPRRLGAIFLATTTFLGACMAAIGALHSLLPVLVVLAAMGLGGGFVNVHVASWCQARVDRALLGRVMSVLTFGAIGLIPVSYAVAGALVQISLPLMFFASGALVVAVSVVAAATGGVKAIE